MAKWPTGVHEDMWTFALRHAVNFHNASLHKHQQESPYKLFTGQEAPWMLRDFKIFGCPVYVLDKDLQDGKSINKWKTRSWQGIYIGNSNCHASSVPLIYNPVTTHITPQFHVIFDESFKTATGDITTTHSSYFDKLYESAAHWMYQDKFTDTPYTFTSFWTGAPPIMYGDHQDKYKRRKLVAKDTAIPNVPLRGSTDPTIQSNSHYSTPLRGSLNVLPQAHPDQHNTPLRGSQELWPMRRTLKHFMSVTLRYQRP
jgi:hypothetical protein